MERAEGGELFEHVIRANGLGETGSRDLFRQVCGALATAHALGIAHRDLKLENLLLCKPPGGAANADAGKQRVKLIDWGLAHVHELAANSQPVPERLHSRCGSRSYMAPEVNDRSISGTVGYDGFRADVWSLGVCLFAMVFGFFPFEQAVPEADWRAKWVVHAQRQGQSTMATILAFYPHRPYRLSAPLLALLDRMLVFAPERRASLDEVLASEWLVSAACDTSKAPWATPRDDLQLADARTLSVDHSSPVSTPPATRNNSHEQSTLRTERQESTSTTRSVSTLNSSVLQSQAEDENSRHASAGKPREFLQPEVRYAVAGGSASVGQLMQKQTHAAQALARAQPLSWMQGSMAEATAKPNNQSPHSDLRSLRRVCAHTMHAERSNVNEAGAGGGARSTSAPQPGKVRRV